jgi:hypothetical protein
MAANRLFAAAPPEISPRSAKTQPAAATQLAATQLAATQLAATQLAATQLAATLPAAKRPAPDEDLPAAKRQAVVEPLPLILELNPAAAIVWVLSGGENRAVRCWTAFEVFDFTNADVFPEGATLKTKVDFVEKRASEYRAVAAAGGGGGQLAASAAVRVQYWSRAPPDFVGAPPCW